MLIYIYFVGSHIILIYRSKKDVVSGGISEKENYNQISFCS